MTAVSPPFVLQAGSHPASTVRQMLQAVTGSPFGAFAGGMQPTTGGGGHAVCSPTDLLTTQNGTPNMSVNVAGGMALVRGTESTHQGVHSFYNDGTVNLAVSAADPTNPRRDAVAVRVRDAAYSGASNDVALVVVTGTPAASPSDPTLPANTLVLDRVAVAAAATSITNANITRLAPRAAALGGCVTCTSTTRPTGAALYSGLDIYEIDTNRALTYDGTGWVIMAEPLQTYTPTLTNITLGNGTRTGSFHRSDGWCDFELSFAFGSTSAFTGGIGFSLPVAANVANGSNKVVSVEFFHSGLGMGHDLQNSATTVLPGYISSLTAGMTAVDATHPYTWVTGDAIWIGGRYRMTTRYS